MTLTVGSVCSGIAAPEAAWASLGWDFLWSADIEPFPNTVRAARFQGVPNLGDMTAIAARVFAGEVAAPDVLVGGTPCQSFSVAGLRKGLADERGNLALEFIRLADAIDAVRRTAGKPPCFVLWENVPGVLSDGGNAFGAFLAGLVGSDAPLLPRGRWTDAGVVSGPGRCAAWRILDAQFYGLAQRRERVFVLARGGAGAWAVADALLPVIPRVRWHPAPRREAREAVAGPIASCAPGGSGYRNDADTAENLIAHSLRAQAQPSHRADSETYVPVAFGGNNTAGPIDIAAALNACPTAAGRQDFESETFLVDVAHTLRADGFDASEDGTGRGTPLVPVAATLSAGGHPNSAAPGRRREDDHNLVAHAFDARQSAVLQYGDRAGPLDTDGGGIGVLAGALCRDSYSGGAGGRPEGAAAGHYLPAGMAVRRLTPRECERLQGFPDDWTLIEHRRKPAADGPRYRALGNSMAVPVLAWIGRQIQSVQ